jgi:hypothetical protein
MALAKASALLGPMSRPCQPSGMPSASVTNFFSALSANLLAMTKSTGKCTVTPFFLALSSSLPTMAAPLSSKIELPMRMPATFLKV